MFIKPGVRLHGIRPEIVLAITIVETVFNKLGLEEPTVTSVIDGVHGRASLHFVGAAFDIRTRMFDALTVERIVQEISIRLGIDFDVVNAHGSATGPHIHIEFQPKTAYK